MGRPARRDPTHPRDDSPLGDQDLERFWTACDSRPPLRLLVQERERSWDDSLCTFDRPFVLVGRDPRNDLVLNHPQVSRRHAYIQVVSGRPFCFDLDSRTAISWSGALRRSGWLQPNRPIQLGKFQLSLPAGDTSRGEPPAIAPDEPPIRADRARTGAAGAPPRLVLERVDAAGSVSRWSVDRLLSLIGRSPDCALKLSDLSVSRFHCALLKNGPDLWVVDLLGRDGTLVNGESVRWSSLSPGDRLQVGRFDLVLREGSELTPRRRTRAAFQPFEPGPPRPELRVVALPAEPEEPPTPQPSRSLASSFVEPSPATAFLPAPISYTAPPARVEPLAAEVLPDTIRYAETLLAPILNQMSMMQQQMFEQYHQSMMTMMQMFGQLHQDQQQLVDRELDEIRRLTREVREVQESLARTPPPPPSVPPPAPTAAPSPQPPRAAAPAPAATTPRAPEPPLPPPDADYRQAHAALIQRMTNLQQERQSRWQSLLGRISGGRSD